MLKPCDESINFDRTLYSELENENRHRTLFERQQQEYERAEREERK